jgi:hypothetical protein
MPINAPNPLTGYHHGGLLEEGRVQVTKTVLQKDGRSKRCESVGSSDEDDELIDEDDNREHPNLRAQWTWTDVKR